MIKYIKNIISKLTAYSHESFTFTFPVKDKIEHNVSNEEFYLELENLVFVTRKDNLFVYINDNWIYFIKMGVRNYKLERTKKDEDQK